LITCGEDKIANVWNLCTSSGDKSALTFDTKFAETSHQKTIRDVAWSPCGKFVVLASFDAQVTLWEVKKGEFEMISVVEGHENEVKSVSWSPSGKYFASCGRDKNVMIWTMITEKDDIDVECSGVLTNHSQDVKRVVWHPHEDILASSSYDDTIKLYENDMDNGDWATIASLAGHSSTVWAIDFDSTGNRLASCSDDKTVKIWQRAEDKSWACVCTIGGYHKRAIYDISWNKLNGLIATACGDNHLRIFKELTPTNELDRNSFEQIFSTKPSSTDLNCVKWSSVKPNLLASASDDGKLIIWEWKDEL